MPRNEQKASRQLKRHAHLLAWCACKMQNCPYCGEPLLSKAPEEHQERPRAKAIESVTVHHRDGNHDNWSPGNLVFMHKSCHKSFHMTGRRRRMEAERRIESHLRELEDVAL